ncbi:MAG: hypothetical protein JSW73_03120 [Candidatus Woesearchaeota archaeon]|nr:MAG: hypothetical protein JSW73_03120 [Candidatus Woesearchaeota archaeon]
MISQSSIQYGQEAAIKARLDDHKIVRKMSCAFVGEEPESTPNLKNISDEAVKNLKKGIIIRRLVNMNYPENIKKAEHLSKYGAEYRHYPVYGFTMSIIDEEKVRIELPDKEKDRILIWINNNNFAEKMQDYFDMCWKSAENLEVQKDE